MAKKKPQPPTKEEDVTSETPIEEPPRQKSRVRKVLGAIAAGAAALAAGAGTIYAYRKATAAAAESARKIGRMRGDLLIRPGDVAKAVTEQITGFPLATMEVDRLAAVREQEAETEKKIASFKTAREKKESKERKRAVIQGLKEAVKERKEAGQAAKALYQEAASKGAARMREMELREEVRKRSEPQPMTGVEMMVPVSGEWKGEAVSQPSRIEAVQKPAEAVRKPAMRFGDVEMGLSRRVGQERPRFAESMLDENITALPYFQPSKRRDVKVSPVEIPITPKRKAKTSTNKTTTIIPAPPKTPRKRSRTELETELESRASKKMKK